jgi:uncharacterized protein
MTGQPGKLICLYVNERDQYDGKPLYEAVVDRCRDLRIAGVTVLRALEGFDETAELHDQHLFRSDRPIVIMIVESPEKARETVPVLESMMNSGAIALTDVDVTRASEGTRTAEGF